MIAYIYIYKQRRKAGQSSQHHYDYIHVTDECIKAADTQKVLKRQILRVTVTFQEIYISKVW